MDQEIAFENYLRDCYLTPEVFHQSWNTWQRLRPFLPVPCACTGPDGKMFYSWDQGEHHLELEILPGESPEFFYCNRQTEEYWGLDWITEDVPAIVQEVASWIGQG